MNILAAANF